MVGDEEEDKLALCAEVRGIRCVYVDSNTPTTDSEGKPESEKVLSDRFWTRYLDINKKYDKEQIEIWKSDAEGILLFTGLFSATVAAFIVESYKLLEPDPDDTMVVLLSQLVTIANGTLQPPPRPITPFSPPHGVIDVNVFWFSSLILSLTCALSATLVQQWTRDYKQAVFDEHASPQERGRLRGFLFAGVERFRLPTVTNVLPLLLHTSVFLFFSGVVEFLWPINRRVALTESLSSSASLAPYMSCSRFSPYLWLNALTARL
ncbi:hypothetical protein OF83DRAFT_1180609 [Amylostereum chailletii]|nr:hypothetical protein OF83DRAFT_1180609 [Amylostereum chailletii]